MPRPSNTEAREALRRRLWRGPAATGELASELGVSSPSVYRMVQELGAEVVSAGRTRQRKHALRRPLRGTTASIVAYAVDAAGAAAPLEPIELVHPQGCLARLDATWPLAPEQDGWWEGLPYPVNDMRPQGYLGRQTARAVAQQLNVSENPLEWSDDDILAYLVQFGIDQPGNLIVGAGAMQAWSQARVRGITEVVAQERTAQRYCELADRAIADGAAGSSAGGEFPKFTASRHLHGAQTPHVIVKFSGADDSASVRRWSDLLVCEHLALQSLSSLPGHAVARSRILQHSGRTFLESERFDRHGAFGRSAVVTLESLEAALIGSAHSQWAQVLADAPRGMFPAAVIQRTEELTWFGRFIANSDMHRGNLSLRPRGDHFELAPAYDMLPMFYAPLRGGEVPQRTFSTEGLPLPGHGREQAWHQVLQAAIGFWRTAAQDSRISEGFRSISRENSELLLRWADVWRPNENEAVRERLRG